MQIRTEEMHRLAEEGIAAHWKYKEGRVGDQRDEHYFLWMRQLLEWQQEVRDPQEFIQNLKIDLYPEEVYTFTPQGAGEGAARAARRRSTSPTRSTPTSATSASARASTAGWCRSAPASRTATSSKSSPSGAQAEPRLAELRRAPRARATRSSTCSRPRRRTRAVELGRKLFEKEARRFDLNPKTLLDGEAFATVLGRFRRAEDRRAARAIGYGKLQPEQVLEQAGARPDKLKRSRPRTRVVSVVRRVLGPATEKIKVRGADDLMVFRARCCNPIRGEKIVGYITRGKGVSVHSATCPNVINLLYDPERRIDVEWDKGDAAARYTVKLTMEVEDRKGMLAEVSAKIADINTNITNVEARTGDDAARAHRHDGRDQRREAPREGDQVAARRGWGARRRTRGRATAAGSLGVGSPVVSRERR